LYSAVKSEDTDALKKIQRRFPFIQRLMLFSLFGACRRLGRGRGCWTNSFTFH